MSTVWHRHHLLNYLQTLLLVLMLLAILAISGQLLFGDSGLWAALGVGLFALMVEPGAAARLTLRLYKARPLAPAEVPRLFELVRILARRAGITSMPQLYYVPSQVANAFAVGSRQSPAIAVSDGLLRLLDQRELVAVLAHEMSHISHGDLRVMGLADSVSRLTSLLAAMGQLLMLLSLPLILLGDMQINWWGFLFLILSPQLALLAQLGLSRVREYDADLNAVRLTGDPQGLAMALARIDKVSQNWRRWVMPGWGNPEPSWLRTHPETSQRIQRLLEQTPDPRQWLHHNSQPTWHQHQAITRPPRWYRGGYWH